MRTLSFSTMWAQQERFRDLEPFRRLVAEFGFTGIEVSHSTDAAGLGTLMSPGEIGLTSLHAPTPSRKLVDGRPNGDANLASTDEDERQLALVETKRTLDFASQASLPYAVVHLGGVGNYMTEDERQLRRLFQSGDSDTAEAAGLRRSLVAWRAAEAEACIETAKVSLRELVDYAAPLGIAIGIESRLHFHEIPHPQEAPFLLEGFNTDQAGYWHDVGHCEVQARLGLIDREAWFPLLTPLTIGSHLHDVDGIADHRAPANGDVNWAYIAAGLPDEALRVFEIDQRQPDDKVAASIRFLQEQGVV